MDKSTAERWVTISAVLVAGIYAYRRLTEATSQPVTLKKLIGGGGIPPLCAFATAWGFTYLVVAIMTEAAPGLGGAFAILIATSDFLTNSASVFQDVGKQEGTAAQAPAAGQQAPPTVIAGETPASPGLATSGVPHGAGTITPTPGAAR